MKRKFEGRNSMYVDNIKNDLTVFRYELIFIEFDDRMTVHRNRFLMNKTNRCTEFKFYWYYYSTCFGQPFCTSSGVLSHTSALVHFMQIWWPFATSSRMELQVCYQEQDGTASSIRLLVANGHQICIKCTNADVRLRTPDDGQKGCPKHVRVIIPIKLEFSAST